MNTYFSHTAFVKMLTVVAIVGLGLVLALGPLFVSGQAVAAPAAAATPTLAGAQSVGSKGGAFNCGGWTVLVPANVVPDGGLIHCGSFDPTQAPAGPAGYTLLRHTVNANIYDNKGQWITGFNPPLTFCYAYNDAELAAARGDLRNFNILTAPIDGIWSVLLAEVTPQTRLVCARTNHLTLFDLALSGAPKAVLYGPTPVVSTVSVTFAYSYKHTVRPGENLFRISLQYNTTVLAIQAANGLASTYIYVGEVLLIPTNVKYTGSATTTVFVAATVVKTPTGVAPAATTYVVQAGDNLFRISLRFNTTVAAIQAANGLTSTYIYVGQVLKIPGR